MANEHAGHAYVHGTSEREQVRLVRQAEILRPVLLAGLDLAAGERVLEVGCGVGAVLGELAAAEPTLQLTGLDRSAEQLAGARRRSRRLPPTSSTSCGPSWPR